MSMGIAQIEKLMSDKLAHLYDKREQRQMLYWILEDISGVKKTDILSDKLWSLDLKYQKTLNSFIDRLAQNEPFQYVLGYAPFMDYELKVSNDVLIPRPETEELVMWVRESYDHMQALNIIDVGTGSGCIAISLKDHFVHSHVIALDISKRALEVVKENCLRTGIDVETLNLDILSHKIIEHFDNDFDIVVSNPPYITETELNNLNLDHEPRSALLVPDNDPLLFYKALLKLSNKKLKTGGHLFVECSEFYALGVFELFKNGGLINVEIKKDMQGKNRMIRAEK